MPARRGDGSTETHGVLSQMLGNLQHQPDVVVLHLQGVEDGRQLAVKLDVDDGTNDRHNLAGGDGGGGHGTRCSARERHTEATRVGEGGRECEPERTERGCGVEASLATESPCPWEADYPPTEPGIGFIAARRHSVAHRGAQASH